MHSKIIYEFTFINLDIFETNDFLMKFNLYSLEYRIIVRKNLFIDIIIILEGPPTLKK